MPEPLYEQTEVDWNEALDRFDQEIYPVLFEKRGITKGEAMIIWSLGNLKASLDEFLEQADNGNGDTF